MSALSPRRSSIISTSTSITSTARMRVMKVFARYQVSVREGKKSNSIGGLYGDHAARSVAPAPQPPQALGKLCVGGFKPADGLPAGNIGDAIEHPQDQRREDRERAPQREIGI